MSWSELLRLKTWRDYPGLALHSVFWGILWALRLGWPYSRLLCRLGRYTQYQPGVCGYCGKRHVAVAKKWHGWRPQDGTEQISGPYQAKR